MGGFVGWWRGRGRTGKVILFVAPVATIAVAVSLILTGGSSPAGGRAAREEAARDKLCADLSLLEGTRIPQLNRLKSDLESDRAAFQALGDTREVAAVDGLIAADERLVQVIAAHGDSSAATSQLLKALRPSGCETS